MKLWTINKVIRKIGVVLVVKMGKDTEIYFERLKTFDRKCTNGKDTP